MQRRQFTKTLPALLALLGLSSVVRAAPFTASVYLAKIRVTSEGADIYASSGLSGVTAELQEQMSACRLSHSSFSESSTFANATLVELADDEGKFTISAGDGFVDVVCYGPNAQPASNYHFQIRVDVVS